MSTEGQAAAPAPAPAPAAASPVDRITAMLAAENAPPPPPQEEAAPAEEPSPAADYEPGQNTAPEGEEAPPGQEAPAEEEPAAMAEIPLDQLESIALDVTIKGDDGKDVTEKPTIKELREGYMRQRDYSRKTAEVARQREEVPEKIRQGIESARSQYVQDLQVLQATLLETVAPELKDTDWNKLATDDAFEYVRRRNRADQITQVITSVQKRIADAKAQAEAQSAETHKTRVAKAIETLESRIPGWSDSLYQTLIKTGQDYGFKAEEVGAWLDPRSLEVLHDAYQYRQQKAKLTPPPPTKKVSVPPKVLKPGAAPAQAQVQVRAQEAMKRLQGSGRLTDAAAVIKARMG